MHISDGILDNRVVILTAATAAVGVYRGLKILEFDDIPKAALLAAAFFVVGLIHINIGISSVHLVLNGLMGVMLGWSVFPVLAVSLGLQYLFFGFGGITSLGANITVMGYSSIFCYVIYRYLLAKTSFLSKKIFVAGFLVGAVSIIFNLAILSVVLLLSGREFILAVWTVSISHLPVMVIEGFVTGVVFKFADRAMPQIFPKVDVVEKCENEGISET